MCLLIEYLLCACNSREVELNFRQRTQSIFLRMVVFPNVIFYQNAIIQTNLIYYLFSLCGSVIRTSIAYNLLWLQDQLECDYEVPLMSLTAVHYLLTTPFRIYNMTVMLIRRDVHDFLKYQIVADSIYLILIGITGDSVYCDRIKILITAYLGAVFIFSFCEMILYFTIECMYHILDRALTEQELRIQFSQLDTYRYIGNQKLQSTTDSTRQIELREEHCPIGLDEFRHNDRVVVLECQHQFKEDNLKEWLNVRRICPLCNARLIIPV